MKEKTVEYEPNVDYMQEKDAVVPMRNYKDRIFRMIFKEKKEFLELYNAMNGTSYDRTEELTVTTLENAIYINMKNDVSYLIHDQLSIYEHQSTRNPNIPLRNLFYVANIYSALTKDINLYGSKLARIPRPVFVEFYNGIEPMPERSVLRLSEAYGDAGEQQQREKGLCQIEGRRPQLELETLVLNINPGYNEKLKESCRTLKEYMLYVKKVREFSRVMSFDNAVEKAVGECIQEGILAEFLKKNRAEVIKVSIYEFDEEQYKRWIKEEAWEEGMEQGIEQGIEKGIEKGIEQGTNRINELNKQLLDAGRREEMIKAVTDKELQQKLLKEYGL